MLQDSIVKSNQNELYFQLYINTMNKTSFSYKLTLAKDLNKLLEV